MERVSHDGRETAHRVVDAGTGPTVLYIHGSGGTHRVWARQYDSPNRTTAALDLSGHGESADIQVGAGDATMSAYADDVLAVAQLIDADVLVGNSLGGTVAQWVALETEWQPAALILTGTGPTLPVFDGLREWLATDFERAIEFLHARDHLFHDVEAQVGDRSRAEMRSTGQAVTRRDFLTCHRFDVTDRLPAIDVPTLALCGEHDQLTPREPHERLAREIPGGELDVVPDAAHLAMLEQPSAFNEAVDGFLRAHLSD